MLAYARQRTCNENTKRIVLLMIAKPVAKLSSVKAAAAKKTSSTEPTVTTLSQVTGGRGTLKRHRQLQQLFDFHQQQRDFDLFSSTPYRSDKPIKLVGFTAFSFSFTAVLGLILCRTFSLLTLDTVLLFV